MRSDQIESLISHLSNEISTLETARIAWRNRVMSVLFVAPFLVMSSLLIIFRDSNINFEEANYYMLLFSLGSWILLGLLAGAVELMMWRASNKFRRTIHSLIKNQVEVDVNDIVRTSDIDLYVINFKQLIIPIYLVAYFIMGCNFYFTFAFILSVIR